MATTNEPYVSGFNIEITETNMQMHVQDINGLNMAGAAITIVFNNKTVDGICDAEGCFEALIKPGVICSVTITKPGYKVWNSRLVLMPFSALTDPNKSFITKVVDINDATVVGASVTITSDVHQVNGITDSEGMFEGDLETDYSNSIDISLSGYQSYSRSVHPYVPFNCGNAQYRLVPVISLDTT